MTKPIRKYIARRQLVAVALAASVSFPSLALAQASTANPPVRMVQDENGVDLSTGKLTMNFPDLSIGDPNSGGMDHSLTWLNGSGYRDAYNALLNATSTSAEVSIGGTTDSFSRSGSTFTSLGANGATLVISGSNYIYTKSDGTQITFATYGGSYFAGAGGWTPTAIGTLIKKPNGETLALNYYSDVLDLRFEGGGIYQFDRLDNVVSSTGYQLRYSYQTTALSSYDNSVNQQWMTESGVTAVNNTVDCATCSLTQSWPTVNYGAGGTNLTSITDPAGLATTFNNVGNAFTSVTLPGHSSPDTTITIYGGTGVTSVELGKIHQITKGANTTTYDWSLSGTTLTATITDTLSRNRTVTSDTSKSVILTYTDAASHTTSYGYDSYGRMTSVTLPLGQVISYVYDARGNRTSSTYAPTSGSGLSNIVTTANYPLSCTNPVTCNEPTSETDARGKVTSYSYDATTGLVTQIVAPADSSGNHPTTNFSYSSQYAWIKNSSGALVAASAPVSLLTTISTCQASPSCTSGTADEARTTIAYEAGSSSVKSNLQPVTVSKGSGASPSMQVVTSTYDNIGNVVSVDGPLSGSADTVRTTYDADRRVIGIVGPDPDGTGSLLPAAIKYTFNSSTGMLDKVEAGTVANPTDNPAGLTVLQATDYSYDSLGQKTRERQLASGAPVTILSYKYDAGERLICTSVTMNVAYPSSDACTPSGTVGSDGPDRITAATYNALDQVTQVQTGYGVAPRNLASYTYTSNGKLNTLTDANGNTTTYTYDGHDRLSRTSYPNTTIGSGTSSSSDYDELVYDAGSNVTSRHLRGYASDSTKHIDYTYDDLGRLITKHVGDDSINDVYYGYDLVGRMLYAHFTSTTGAGITNSFDALGRLTSTVNNMGTTSRTLSYGYDSAGNRTQLTYPDGNYFSYDRDTLGRMTAIRENGGTTAVSTTYDSLGRVASQTRGAVTITPGYDAVSRLTSLTHDLSGTSSDVTFTYGYNAAGQITSKTRSNDAYAFGGYADATRSTPANGLNQMTSSGTHTLGYDARGNLITDTVSGVTTTYNYDAENHLLGVTGVATNSYDPLGRLWKTTTPSKTIEFVTDGDQLVMEYNGANTLYHAHDDAGTPLLQYTGPGFGSRMSLQTDHQGSVISVADATGTMYHINSYDEDYGIYGGLYGRFGYTGQQVMPQLGLIYYKARVYSPTLGRFMQTDPIGYGDGPNWYSYVHGDPVNGVDPSGLVEDIVSTGCSNGHDGKTIHDNGTGGSFCTWGGPSGGGFFGGYGGYSYNPGITQFAQPSKGAFPPGQKPQNVPCAPAGSAPTPSQYAAAGTTDKDLRDGVADSSDPIGGAQAAFYAAGRNMLDLASFKRGGPLDAQVRYGGSPAYANYVFGVYMSASGFSLQETLWAADQYGKYRSAYPSTVQMDSTYTHIPASNVANIKKGYNDQANNAMCVVKR